MSQQSEQLTPREFEVAKLVADAFTDHQIAHQLRISVFTARFYVDNILYKLGLPNRVAICKWWYLNHYKPSSSTPR
jgi:DNA-binding CsgD family transcriptional regulator